MADKRRDKGEGSVYFRESDQRWVAKYKHENSSKLKVLYGKTVTPADIQNMVNKLIAKGYSYSTIKKAYDAINGCFKSGVNKGEILKNPCVEISLPKNENKKKDGIFHFNDEQIKLICEESVIYNWCTSI